MQQHEYIERNIKTFTEKADNGKVFGCSYLQRICGVGYNQAQDTIEEMKKRGLIKTHGDYTFRLSNQPCSNQDAP